MAMRQQPRQITPAQRAELFAQMTRQHIQPIAAQTGASEARLTFDVPRVRLLSSIRLMVEATLTATHASLTSYVPHVFAPYNLLRNIRVETNFGFNPWRVSGRDAYFMMLQNHQSDVFVPAHLAQAAAAVSRARAVQGITASPGGTVNTVRFMIDLPLTLNNRDPVGLIMTQNEETRVNVHIDLGSAADIAPTAAGFTFALGSVTITPITETFSIPAVPDAFPDISILKLVQTQTIPIPGAGVREIAMPTGTTYRKLLFFVADAAGAGVADTSLTGDIELVLNIADTPYRIRPSVLASLNTEVLGRPLPSGLYAFDFSAGMGLPNYSGARDYIDTERLTEFWLRLNPSAAGSITVISEMLTRLV